MCGIFGVFLKNSEGSSGFIEEYKPVVRKALEDLSHRGPDDGGIFSSVENGFILGHRRLSILDLSKNGSQPFKTSTCENILVYNGEIYNFLEIKENFLKNYNFISSSDTEVLYNLYLEKKDETPKFLNGMFSFCIWDDKKKSLFLSRDLLGEKPLYYCIFGDIFFFSSEINALKNAIGNNILSIEERSVHDFLRLGYIPGTNTIYSQIKELSPGFSLMIDKNFSVSIRPYEQLLPAENNNKLTFQDAVSSTEEILKNAISLRLRSDVPLGVFLSGGIDSCLIASIASQYVPGIKSFTFSSGEKALDESLAAKKVADLYGMSFTRIELESTNIKNDIFNILSLYGEPYADASAIPSYYVSKSARKELKVALVGDGGDEVFGGYRRYKFSYVEDILLNILSREKIRNGSKFLKRFIPDSSEMRSKLNFINRSIDCLSLDEESSFIAQRGEGFNTKDMNILCGKKIDNSFFLGNLLDNLRMLNSQNKSIFSDIMCELPYDLLIKMDISSMRHSLEVRSPFLDKRLVKLGMSLPSSYKATSFNTKIILREIAKKYLPLSIYNAPKKGFEVPYLKWIKADLFDLCNQIIKDKNSLIYNYFNFELSSSHLFKILDRGFPSDLKKIWLVLCLEVWNKTK